MSATNQEFTTGHYARVGADMSNVDGRYRVHGDDVLMPSSLPRVPEQALVKPSRKASPSAWVNSHTGHNAPGQKRQIQVARQLRYAAAMASLRAFDMPLDSAVAICYLCASSPDASLRAYALHHIALMDVEHLDPSTKGIPHYMGGVMLACVPCNRARKGNRAASSRMVALCNASTLFTDYPATSPTGLGLWLERIGTASSVGITPDSRVVAGGPPWNM